LSNNIIIPSKKNFQKNVNDKQMNYLNKMMKLKNDHKSNDKDKNQNVKAFQIEINNNNILFRFIDINKLKYNMNKYIANKDLNNNNYQNINDGLKNENFI